MLYVLLDTKMHIVMTVALWLVGVLLIVSKEYFFSLVFQSTSPTDQLCTDLQSDTGGARSVMVAGNQ